MIHTGSKREWGQMEREGRSVDLVRTCRLNIITLIAHGHEEKNGSPSVIPLEQFSIECRKKPKRSKNSPPKLKPITTWLPAFSHTLGSLVGFTSSSHWLFKVFSSLPIGCCDNFCFTILNRKVLYLARRIKLKKVSVEQMTHSLVENQH